ncbi:MAG: histidinol-phosphate transaminase [Alphaproteobacteria bacterium]|jgi:histidinol-phosphate aminotransferase|nr:histidinol-phosphate transaminase [Alphaproteobacteria bacterium]MDP6566243.1 histidinol-phosphate transaminase [Alphaproteobacteria bacterium]MDP6815188.1 histidinol-phosphate transaminase [Alphaproteobacteria bacterium]
MAGPKPVPGILDIAPYVGGDSSVEGLSRAIKLSSNEAATGASPRAVAALTEAGQTIHRYPDGGANELRVALAEMHGLNRDGVICANGSDEIISYLCHAYAGPGDDVVFSEHGFLMYPLSAMACGARPIKAPESEFTASVDSVLSTVTDRTKIVFLANPNNPTGTYLPVDEVRRLRAGLAPEILLVIDCAYAEFVGRNDYSTCVDLVESHDNVVMTRTFSKIYGLAALRLGWAYCPEEIAGVFHRVRPPFNVNAAAQAAGVAALLDIAHTDRARAHNDRWLPWLSEEFGKLGLPVIPSVANFVTVRFDPDGPGSADKALAFLNGKGILPRGIAPYGLADHLRFTVGLEEENRAAVAAVAEFLGTRDGG